MEKKEYLKPTMQVVEIQLHQILSNSPIPLDKTTDVSSEEDVW